MLESVSATAKRSRVSAQGVASQNNIFFLFWGATSGVRVRVIFTLRLLLFMLLLAVFLFVLTDCVQLKSPFHCVGPELTTVTAGVTFL